MHQFTYVDSAYTHGRQIYGQKINNENIVVLPKNSKQVSSPLAGHLAICHHLPDHSSRKRGRSITQPSIHQVSRVSICPSNALKHRIFFPLPQLVRKIPLRSDFTLKLRFLPLYFPGFSIYSLDSFLDLIFLPCLLIQ